MPDIETLHKAIILSQSKESIIIFVSLYFLPTLSLLRIKLPDPFFLINRFLGWIDRYLATIRIFTNVILFFLLFLVLFLGPTTEKIITISVTIFFIAVDLLNRRLKWKKRMTLAIALGKVPAPSPKEVFRLLDSASGPFIIPIGKIADIKIDNIDFRGKHIFLPITYFKGIISTIRMTRLGIRVAKKLKEKESHLIAASIAASWGLSILKTCKAAIKVRRSECLNKINDRTIYLITHGSFLDFAFSPLLIAHRRQLGTKVALPSFLVAQNHFKYNPFYRWILGIGEAAKSLGMIFTPRTGKKEDAQNVVAKSVDVILSGEDLMIFPQGTRAHGRLDRFGNRIEAGYYSVGGKKRLAKENSHLKKGTAYIAMSLASQKIEATLLPVALRGTSIICPKNSMKLQSGVYVEFIISDPIRISDIKTKKPEFITSLIDDHLQAAMGVNSYVERWLLEDMRRLLPPYELEELALSLKPWRTGDNLLHSLLDIIYTIPLSKRLPILNEAAHLLLASASREQLLDLKKKAADLTS